jgi:hypothetical protein
MTYFTTMKATVLDTTLYDSTDHEEEYNFIPYKQA